MRRFSLPVLTMLAFLPFLPLYGSVMAQPKGLLNCSDPQGCLYLSQATTSRPRIAILDFDFSSVSSPYSSTGASKGVSDLLINKLVKNGSFVVVERSKLDQILAEQNLGSSGRVDASTAAQIGRILGVDAVVIGTVTQFDLSKRSSGGGAPVLAPFGGLPIGIGATSDDADANVRLNARVVSTSTAEILTVAEGNGNASQSDSTVTIAGIGGGSSTSNEQKLLTKATDQAIEQVASQLVSTASRLSALPKALPTVDALVADVSLGSVILNKGSKDGYQVGLKLSIERVVKEVKDPATGSVLRKVTQPIGQIQLSEVDGTSSVGKILAGSGFRVGDVAKPSN